MKNGPVEEFVFTDWLKEGAEGMRGKIARNKIACKKQTLKIDTTEFKTHMRQARKERLLAIRSLVDSALENVTGEDA